MPDSNLIKAMIKNWQTVVMIVGALWVGFKEYDTAKDTIEDYKLFKAGIVEDHESFHEFVDNVEMNLQDLWTFEADVQALRDERDSLVKILNKCVADIKADSVTIRHHGTLINELRNSL